LVVSVVSVLVLVLAAVVAAAVLLMVFAVLDLASAAAFLRHSTRS